MMKLISSTEITDTPIFRVTLDRAIDPDGFDRVAFHKEFNTTVLKFLREHLISANGQ